MRSINRRRGRPCLLTPERVDAIVRASAVGANTLLAAEAAGVSRATLARWLARGRDAAEAREDGAPADPHDDAFVDLYRRVELARAQMATRALARVLQAGAGSLVLEERVRTYTDPVNGLDVEERQVRYLRPDWRAAAWWLARVFPENYGPNAKSWDQVLDEFDAQESRRDHDRAESAELAGLAERLQAALGQATLKLPPPCQEQSEASSTTPLGISRPSLSVAGATVLGTARRVPPFAAASRAHAAGAQSAKVSRGPRS